MSSETLAARQLDGGEIQQRDIAKATPTSEKTFGARNLQGTTQGALDKRILRSVSIVQQNLALNLKKGGGKFRTPGGCDHENLMLELVKF
jgi:hypothetical protein